MTDERTREAVESSNTDELLRIIDGRCQARNWEALLALRILLADAVTRGKQLWGVDQHVRYRLALEGPPAMAGAAVDEGPARFALGPLTEVVANRHTFAELAPYLLPGPARALVAHERVLAGEPISPQEVDPTVLEVPLQLLDWEPAYSRPEYKSDRVESHPPGLPALTPVDLGDRPVSVEDPESTTALLALVAPWIEESSGRAQTACAAGPATDAIGLLGVPRARLGPIAPDLAIAWMAWAAASGGALGRRRGGAAGRFAAWFVLATLVGRDWPPDPDDLGNAIKPLSWYAWSDLAPATGWSLNLAVTDPDEGLSWAIGAIDQA